MALDYLILWNFLLIFVLCFRSWLRCYVLLTFFNLIIRFLNSILGNIILMQLNQIIHHGTHLLQLKLIRLNNILQINSLLLHLLFFLLLHNLLWWLYFNTGNWPLTIITFIFYRLFSRRLWIFDLFFLFLLLAAWMRPIIHTLLGFTGFALFVRGSVIY